MYGMHDSSPGNYFGRPILMNERQNAARAASITLTRIIRDGRAPVMTLLESKQLALISDVQSPCVTRTYHTAQISRDVPASRGMKLRDCGRNAPCPATDIACIFRQ